MCDVVGVSAKKTPGANEIAPYSKFVSVSSNGKCYWLPRFDLSVTRCSVDVKWFPFDSQKCDLPFDWMSVWKNYQLNVTVRSVDDPLFLYNPSDQWDLTCK